MSTFQSQLERYKQAFLEELSLIKTPADLEAFRIKHLSRQGMLADLVQPLKGLPLEEKKVVGALVNTLKNDLQEAYKAQEQAFKEA